MKNILIIFLVANAACSCNQTGQQNKVSSVTDYELNPNPEKTNVIKEKNEALIGLWKSTEILGTGEFTMTNETLIEFLEDGSFLTWPGRSVGPDYSRDEDKSQTSKGSWYTSGKSLHMVDPATGQDAETYCTVSETGLLMSNGSQKKPFVRIR